MAANMCKQNKRNCHKYSVLMYDLVYSILKPKQKLRHLTLNYNLSFYISTIIQHRAGCTGIRELA